MGRDTGGVGSDRWVILKNVCQCRWWFDSVSDKECKSLLWEIWRYYQSAN